MISLDAIPLTAIGIDCGASDVVRYAAKELQKYLKLITGEKLPVTDAGRQNGMIRLKLDPSGYSLRKFDRIRICRKADSLILCGENEISVLYAVYDFLQHFADVRFFAPGAAFEVVPEIPQLAIPGNDLPWENGSAVQIRDFVNRTNFHEVFSFAVKNRINTILGCGPWQDGSDKCSPVNAALIHSFGLKIRGPGHSWKHFIPPPSMYETHPEYFPLVGGKRIVNGRNCCFSNPEARKIFMDNLRSYLRKHPYWDIFAFWAEDVPNGKYCNCDECAKRSTTDWYLSLCNEAAAILAEEIPHAVFEFIVYRDTRMPPDHTVEFFRSGKNMLADFCFNYSRDLFRPFEEQLESSAAVCVEERNWRDFLKRSGYQGKWLMMEYYNLCEYPNCGPCGRALLWPLEIIRQDIRFYLSKGYSGLGAFTGVDKLAFPTPLRLWAWIRLWTDPDAEIESLKQDFYRHYFGSRAQAVRKYADEFERLMFQTVTEENIRQLEQCVKTLESMDGFRIEILRCHHEYAVLLKRVFLAYLMDDRASYDRFSAELKRFPERNARLLAQAAAPFPMLWFDHWCGSRIGWNSRGEKIPIRAGWETILR